MFSLLSVNLRWIVRDRILQALVAVSLLLIFLVPVVSAFSMRQSQEISVTLSLSFVSFVLLLYSVFLGSTLLWRDIERRYTFAVVTLPQSRATYFLAKFFAVALFLAASSLFMSLCAVVAIKLGAMQYQSALPIQWGRIFLAIFMDTIKYTMVTAIALLVSSFATTFFMPFFCTVAVYLAGSASQEVYEYIISEHARKFGTVARALVKLVYYVIPNFASFDFKLQAVYPIPLEAKGIIYPLVYFGIYLTVILTLATWSFARRELT
jgi:ABC-type transport system involved in multi-copper enzyme maturation permease subunit